MHSNNKVTLDVGTLPPAAKCLVDFQSMDRALHHLDRLRASLRLWALSAEQFGQVNTADREELLLSVLDLAEDARDDLAAAMPGHPL